MSIKQITGCLNIAACAAIMNSQHVMSRQRNPPVDYASMLHLQLLPSSRASYVERAVEVTFIEITFKEGEEEKGKNHPMSVACGFHAARQMR